MLAAFTAVLTVAVVVATATAGAAMVRRQTDPTTAHWSTTLPVLGGQEPDTHTWNRFHARYYPMTLVLIAFEMEMMFMYPWAVVFRSLGREGAGRDGRVPRPAVPRGAVRLAGGGPAVAVTDWLDRLADAAPVPVVVARGLGGHAAVARLRADARVRVVASPRHATVLVVTGAIPHGHLDALAHVHDQVPSPRGGRHVRAGR